jgi:hypothetical protein
MDLVAITVQGGIRLAEVGFLLEAIAGIVLALPVVAPAARQTVRFVSGVALAIGAVLLIVAVHWGHFG